MKTLLGDSSRCFEEKFGFIQKLTTESATRESQLRGQVAGIRRVSPLRALQEVWRGSLHSDELSPEDHTILFPELLHSGLSPRSLVRPGHSYQSPCSLSHSHNILFIPLLDLSVRITPNKQLCLWLDMKWLLFCRWFYFLWPRRWLLWFLSF